ncbi:hypothetical protein F7725_022113 [Dissostichus mawsoni]|uniref:Uncharacterized protein n=1 Tax=Dissostichus mawsoni TaxID=36200 RepID=A0A7J5ZD19_DISMA|nr:hypothetical protein F7725_022113 [Dissostichus mawsoni]
MEVSSFSSSSVPASPWKSLSYSGSGSWSGSCKVSAGDRWDWKQASVRFLFPRPLGLGKLRTDALDDCLENWSENCRPEVWRGGGASNETPLVPAGSGSNRRKSWS